MQILIAVELEERHLDQIQRVSPHVTLQSAHDEKQLKRLLPDAEILVGWSSTATQFRVEEASNLKWFNIWGAGVDNLLDQPIMQSDILLTNTGGIGVPISEYVASQMVALSRGFLQMMRNQQAHRWGREDFALPPRSELGGRKLGIVGYGRIGQEIARVGLCFGMSVIATSAVVHKRQREGEVEVLPADGLMELLAASDFVVLSLPLTPATEGLIGERELRAMKPTSYLINVARGKIVDEPALIEALREGWIAGAALDVFIQEPLPPDSEFWKLPNLFISPHVCGYTDGHTDRATDIFCENLRRYLAGEELDSVVIKGRGF
jgi:phosphoglycerate dehydrogenase-like enzyme